VTLEGKKYILTFQDNLSKYVVAVPIGQQDAETVARAFMEKIILTFGTPQTLQTDSIVGAQKASPPPRVISPILLLDTLKSSSPSFPADTTFPFPLGKDYLHSVYQLSDVHVCTYKERLGYVITVPLVRKKTFTVLRMIPIPVPVNREHFLYIDVRESVLCLDRARQYYFPKKGCIIR